MTGHDQTDPRLAFLVFRSRSGSTFFGDRLNRHPQLLVTPESNLAPKLIKFLGSRRAEPPTASAIADHIFLEPKFRQWNLPRENLVHALNTCVPLDWSSVFQIICRVYRDHQKPEAGVVVFKNSGWYYENIDLLLSTFSGSSALGVVRDPRAVFNSARKALHSEKKRPMAENVFKHALGWRRHIRLLEQTEVKHSGRIHRFKYETFIHDLPGTLNQAWKSLGLRQLNKSEFTDIMDSRNDSHLVSESARHLHSNVLREPMPELAQKWRSELPRWQAFIIRHICAKEMREFGYF